MTRLAWGAHGERFFETGTDRGVLYLTGAPGVPWNGLKAVNESPTGGEPRPYYLDGYKYLNVASAEEYAATLEAFSSPREFAVCDGTLGIHNGLFVTQQPRSQFGLSYRTLVGNDKDGDQHGYKIHLVYNALAAPSQRNNQTTGDGVNPLTLSWSITTQPPLLAGIKPTAHFVIDSRFTPPVLLKTIEDILYGSIDGDARLPSVQELADLFRSEGPLVATNEFVYPSFELGNSAWATFRRNYICDPRFTNLSNWSFLNGTATVVDGAADVTMTGNASSNLMYPNPTSWFTGWAVGDPLSGGYVVENLSATEMQLRMAVWNNVAYIYGPTVVIPPGESRLVSISNAVAVSGGSYMQPRLHTVVPVVTGQRYKVSAPIAEKAAAFRSYYDPVNLADTDFRTQWDSTANASPLVLQGRTPVGIGSNSTLFPIHSQRWAGEGLSSLRMHPIYPTRGSGYVDLGSAGNLLERGVEYTALATVRKEFDSLPTTGGIIWTTQGGVGSASQYSSPVAGEYELRIFFTVLASGWGYLRLYHGGAVGESDIWFDKVMLVKGHYNGPWISGDIPDDEIAIYHWEAGANESRSFKHSWY